VLRLYVRIFSLPSRNSAQIKSQPEGRKCLAQAREPWVSVFKSLSAVGAAQGVAVQAKPIISGKNKFDSQAGFFRGATRPSKETKGPSGLLAR